MTDNGENGTIHEEQINIETNNQEQNNNQNPNTSNIINFNIQFKLIHKLHKIKIQIHIKGTLEKYY